MKRRTPFGVAAALLVALAAGAAYWASARTDPALAEAQRLFDEAFERGQRPPREEMRALMSGLTDSQRRAFFMRNRDRIRAQITRRLTETLALPPDERQRAIAERADRLVELRRTDQQPGGQPPSGRGEGGRRGEGGPPGDWANKSQAERMKRVLDFTTPEMRGAFTEMKRQIDEELSARGEPPLEPREMRRLMRDS